MIAKAIGKDMGISTKQSVEICGFIRGKKVERAKRMLNEVIEKKIAVPYRRYNDNVGHKRGRIASGRYPIKACNEILKLVKLAEANAKNLSLPTKDLYIKEIVANKAATPWHFGRHKRRKMKRTHIRIIVEEADKKIQRKDD